MLASPVTATVDDALFGTSCMISLPTAPAAVTTASRPGYARGVPVPPISPRPLHLLPFDNVKYDERIPYGLARHKRMVANVTESVPT